MAGQSPTGRPEACRPACVHPGQICTHMPSQHQPAESAGLGQRAQTAQLTHSESRLAHPGSRLAVRLARTVCDCPVCCYAHPCGRRCPQFLRLYTASSLPSAPRVRPRPHTAATHSAVPAEHPPLKHLGRCLRLQDWISQQHPGDVACAAGLAAYQPAHTQTLSLVGLGGHEHQ